MKKCKNITNLDENKELTSCEKIIYEIIQKKFEEELKKNWQKLYENY